MFFPLFRNPTGRRGNSEFRVGALFLSELNAALDFADGVQIVGHAIAIVRAQTALQAADLSGDGIENAPLRFDPLKSLFGGCAIAEHAVENHTGIDLHRHRRGWRSP